MRYLVPFKLFSCNNKFIKVVFLLPVLNLLRPNIYIQRSIFFLKYVSHITLIYVYTMFWYKNHVPLILYLNFCFLCAFNFCFKVAPKFSMMVTFITAFSLEIRNHILQCTRMPNDFTFHSIDLPIKGLFNLSDFMAVY